MTTPTLAALADALAAPTELAQTTGVLAAAGHPAAGLTLGAGDRLLLGLHRELTGHDVAVSARCPACGVLGEVELGPDTLPSLSTVDKSSPVRPPTYGDLVGLPTGDAGAAELVRRCTLPGGAGAGAEDLAGVDDSLSGPLVFGCPACDVPVECPVDVQPLALRGLLGLLRRYELEVHLLASTYHWDLDTIEALPDSRRQRLALHVEADR